MSGHLKNIPLNMVTVWVCFDDDDDDDDDKYYYMPTAVI
jgi:hypothetical protein